MELVLGRIHLQQGEVGKENIEDCHQDSSGLC